MNQSVGDGGQEGLVEGSGSREWWGIRKHMIGDD